jgi:hypothetical protein
MSIIQLKRQSFDFSHFFLLVVLNEFSHLFYFFPFCWKYVTVHPRYKVTLKLLKKSLRVTQYLIEIWIILWVIVVFFSLFTCAQKYKQKKYEKKRNEISNHEFNRLPESWNCRLHHLWVNILSKVNRLAGLWFRILRKSASVSVSSLLHGVIDVYLFSFHDKYSAQPDDGWSHGSSETRRAGMK